MSTVLCLVPSKLCGLRLILIGTADIGIEITEAHVIDEKFVNGLDGQTLF